MMAASDIPPRSYSAETLLGLAVHFETMARRSYPHRRFYLAQARIYRGLATISNATDRAIATELFESAESEFKQ